MQASDYGKRLLTFAVIADSHLNQDEWDCNSPFPVNKLANRRMRHVVRDLNRRDVAFVVHLGDLIHPVPAVKDLYAGAARRFHAQVRELKAPLYLTPGNHDIGDKPMPWAPAGSITEDYIRLWRETFGADYYSFDHQDIHMVVINSQLLNSGLPAEAEQKLWLEADLQAHADRRIFICTHYPPFLYERNEAEHYDNIAEPERAWLLDLTARYGVEGLFGGHVHNFWYLSEKGTRHYLLPSTAFVRQDYSEMFQAPPALEATEAGRDDAAKLGYFLVHVHERGHLCEMVRTWGACVAPDVPASSGPELLEPVAPARNRYAALGFDLRRNWARGVDIPPSGALDEFDRKRVRNDYLLLALWEMGVRHLRIPLQDLRDAATRQRMRDLLPLGHAFTLYSYGLPAPCDQKLILDNAALLARWEISFRGQEMKRLAAGLRELRQKLTLPVLLSRMWEHEDNRAPDGRYYHVMNHGFTMKDADSIAGMAEFEGLEGTGLVFRAMSHDDLRSLTAFAHETCAARGLPASLHLRLTGFNPAEVMRNDAWVAQRTAEALFCAADRGVTVFADTLTDIDRGYFVHNGVLDSTCNPRRAARVIGHLHAALNRGDGPMSPVETSEARGRWLWTRQGGEPIALYMAGENPANAPLALPPEIFPAAAPVTVIDLDNGRICPAAGLRPAAAPDLYFLRAAH